VFVGRISLHRDRQASTGLNSYRADCRAVGQCRLTDSLDLAGRLALSGP